MTKKRASTPSNLPLQYLLDGDFLRVLPLTQNIQGLSYVPHRHDHYELLYITKGYGLHYIDFKPYEVKPGRVYFQHPGQVHLIDDFEREGWIIVFGPELFRRFLDIHQHLDKAGLLDTYNAHPYIDLDDELVSTLQTMIDLLLTELSAAKPDAGILLHYASSLLLQANRAHLAQHPDHSTSAINKEGFHQLKQLIEANFKTEHSAAYYAQRLKADIKKLNRICRESTGLTVAELLHERLLTESKISLQTTTRSIKQISYDLGFKDPAFFGRFFKRHTSKTPADFRLTRGT